MELEEIEKQFRELVSSRGDRGQLYRDRMWELTFELELELAKELKAFHFDFLDSNPRGL